MVVVEVGMVWMIGAAVWTVSVGIVVYCHHRYIGRLRKQGRELYVDRDRH